MKSELDIPVAYQRYLIHSKVRGLMFVVPTIILLALIMDAVSGGAASRVGVFTGILITLWAGVLSLLDLPHRWFYVIDDAGIRVASRGGFYGIYNNRVCHADWSSQAVLAMQQSEWRGFPVMLLSLAPRDKLEDGQLLTRPRYIQIVYDPEDEGKFLETILPILSQHKFNGELIKS